MLTIRVPSKPIFLIQNRSEDVNLKQALLSYKNIKDEIAVFDRGLQSRKTLVALDNQSIDFVTRLNEKAVYEERGSLSDVAGHRHGHLALQKDILVYLQNFKDGKIRHEFRLIEAINDEGKLLRFLTNMVELSPQEVISIYKYRWQIELFFKSIKKNLKAKHLISYSQNRIVVFAFSSGSGPFPFISLGLSSHVSRIYLPHLK